MAGFFENMWPDGGKGFGAAAGEFAPMLMSMGAAMQQGQSPFAGAQYGLSQMMAMDSTEEDKRRWEEEMELRRNADARAAAAAGRAAASAGRAGAGRAQTEALLAEYLASNGGGGGGGAVPMSPMAAALAGNGGPTRAAGAALDAYSAGNDLRRMGGPYAGFSGGGDLGQSPDALTGADTITGAAGDDMLSAPIYDGEFAAWNDLTEAPKAAPKETPKFNPIRMPEQQQAKPRIDPARAAQILMDPRMPAAVKARVLSMAFPEAAKPEWQRYEAGDGSQWLYDQKNPNNKMQLSPAGGKPSAKDEQIERLVSTGIDRDIAIGIADGAIVVSRDPTTGEAKLVNKGDFERQQPPAPTPQSPPPAPTSGGDPLSPPDFGAARDSFGAEGFVKGILNTGADALQLGTPFPEVQQTQRDLDVLGETLVNDISSAYNRQPPSWLLRDIQALVPSSGNPFKGPEDAKARFRSIGSSITAELRATNDALNNRALSPKTRQDLEARAAQLQGAVGKIRSALQGFDGGGGGNTTKSGVKWRIVE